MYATSANGLRQLSYANDGTNDGRQAVDNHRNSSTSNPHELPQGWRGMTRHGRFDPAVCKTLLVAFTVPLDAGLAEDADPDDMADAIAQIVSEEWWRNTAHEPAYFEPLGVSILPCSPMWVTLPIMRVLKKASELIAAEDAQVEPSAIPQGEPE